MFDDKSESTSTLVDESHIKERRIRDSMPVDNDFGFCAVGQSSERHFKLVNPYSEDRLFSFETCPFKIEPIRDVIPAKGSKIITVSFHPNDASVIVASTLLKVQDEPDKIIKFSAIGKFPFLKTISTKIDFREVMYGKKKTKDLIINNDSEVTTGFRIKKLDFDEYSDTSFSLDVDKGVIPPKSSFLVKITYRPMIWDLYSCSHFLIECQGGNKIEIQCLGKAQSVEARLKSRSIDFGSIRLGSNTNRSVTLNNNSDANCAFEVIIDNSGVFSVKESTGVIKPKAYAKLLFIFTPQRTINYYSRVYILIRNHLALYVDLVGNCYDLLIKPPPMAPHIPKETRAILGLGGTTMFAKSFTQNPDGPLSSPTNHAANEPTDQEEGETTKQIMAQSVQIHKELFGGNDLSEKFVRCSAKFIDFGFSSSTAAGVPTREITIENLSKRKISIFWTNDAPYTGAKQNIFDVFPPSLNLNIGEVAKFTIGFRPNNMSAFYFEKLQAFAIDYDMNMMEKISKASFSMKKRLINVKNLSSVQIHGEDEGKPQMPPIEIGILCSGNSFSPDTQPFIPMIQVLPKNEIVFSPCAVGDTTYCSIQLVNKTDTPSYFKFDSDGGDVFDVFPKYGIVEGHRFKIIFFRFSPKEPELIEKVFHCRLNNAIDVVRIKLTGYCCQPKLEIDNNSQLFFPPSFIGVHSRQMIAFHNRSRVPLSFVIKTPAKFSSEVIFTPSKAILLPNQTDFVSCSLMPLKKKKYHIKVPIDVSSETGVAETETQQIEVYGEGGDGSLVMKPEVVDFGIIKVNFTKTHKITIYNHSHVTFYLNLDIKQMDDTKGSEAMKRALANSFSLDFTEGLITGHSKIEVTITFKPVEICELRVKLVCIAKEKPPLGVFVPEIGTGIVEKCSTELKANGRFPILKIVDIRNEDLSVSRLWNSFKLDRINKDLIDKASGKGESKDFEDLASTLDRDDIIEKNYYEWNFGYLQNKPIIEPRKIVLTIQNVGGTDLDWKFKFPNDNQINAEPWADPGEQSEKEAYEKMVLEKKIFEVYPRSGNLKPNEKQSLQLIYSPNMDEEIYDKKGNKEPTQDHKLRVILSIENGKSLKLLFRGKTLAHLQAQLSFSRDTYNLPALPIGLASPVIIPIPMENVGSGNIRCEIEESEIVKANMDNGAARVFDIENKNSNFTANEKKPLYVSFKPAEAKEYNFFVKVKAFDFVKELEGNRIHLRGWGYDTNSQPPEESKPEATQIPRFKSSNDELSPEAFFSIEEVDFEEVAAGEVVSRIFLLFNNSPTSRLKFEFIKSLFAYKDNLEFSPPSGVLNPLEHVEVKLKLTASQVLSIYEGEVECKITWQDYDRKGKILEDRRSGLGTTSNKNEGSSMPTPKSSADRMKTSENQKGLKSQTLFLRIKKKSKINVSDQKDSKGRDNKDTKQKDQSKEDFPESIYNTILSRAIKDILSSEQATKLVDEVMQQNPRLYCFFDKELPVSVNDMKEDTMMRDEDNDQSVAEMNATRKSQMTNLGEERRTAGEGMNPSNSNNTNSLKNQDLQLSKRLSNLEVASPTQDNIRDQQDQPPNQENSTNNPSAKDKMESQQATLRSGVAERTERDSKGEPSVSKLPPNVPEHLSPNDIIEEEELHEGVEGQQSAESREDEIRHLMATDEFRTVAQSVFDDIFISMIHDAVTGKSSLAEREGKLNARMNSMGGSRNTVNKLRSTVTLGQMGQLSQGQPPGLGSYSASSPSKQ